MNNPESQKLSFKHILVMFGSNKAKKVKINA